MQPFFKSALILDYSMCMIRTLKKKKRKTQVRCFATNSGLKVSRGHNHPLHQPLLGETKAEMEAAAAK